MTPEGQTLRLITEWLSAERIWWRRMNSGAIVSEGASGKRRFHRYGSIGMADILASVMLDFDGKKVPHFLWIEVKAAKGKQSESQVLFQKDVEAEGHIYCLARSIEDVKSALGVQRRSRSPHP